MGCPQGVYYIVYEHVSLPPIRFDQDPFCTDGMSLLFVFCFYLSWYQGLNLGLRNLLHISQVVYH